MNEIVVIVDGAKTSSKSSGSKQVLKLETFGTDANIRLQIDVFRTEFLRELPNRLEDLICLAACIYQADTRISRGTDKDVFDNRWVRKFHIVIPVFDIDFWNNVIVQDSLSETLNFVSGDEFTFEFVKRTNKKIRQGIFNFKELIHPLPKVDVVICFSGGSDSLAATLLAVNEGLHPILVSHRSAPKIVSRQKNLVTLLQNYFTGWDFPHISMWVNRIQGNRPADYSQRTRSFLYTTLSVVAASMLDIDNVWLSDNGVVTINLPQSGQNWGTRLSRSTHPRFIELAQNFMRQVTERNELKIANKLLFHTKKDVLEVIASSGHPELLQETVSCAHVEGTTSFQPHCGVCTQCIDRRFASFAANLTDYDLPSRYKTDIFLSPLKQGEDRTHVENYIRFASKLEQINSSDVFFEEYPELMDCLPSDGDVELFGEEVWNLFQKHQRAVNSVIDNQIALHAREIRQNSLPTNSLLRIVSGGLQNVDVRVKYIKQLKNLICKSVPASFQTNKAKNERNVQDVCETALIAAKEVLQREAPQIPFSVVTTKPDFADVPNGTTPLFIEFKYIKDRPRLNGIITEMTSRILIYKRQGAWVLFIVYDPNRIITDDDKFADDLLEEGIWIGIAR